MTVGSICAEQVRQCIPDDLIKRIQQVEQVWNDCSQRQSNHRIAVFDLDNTLLTGDSGDAVFAQLKTAEKEKPLRVDNQKIPFTWTDYLELLREKGKVEAYSMVTRCMNGIPLQTLREINRQVFRPDVGGVRYLELEGRQVMIPFPHPVMQALVQYLKARGYKIYVISATNQYTVEYAAEVFFGIPGGQAFGMRSELYPEPGVGDVLGDKIDGPVTVSQGKVEAYRDFIGPALPLIAGGDSSTDIPMLNLTQPGGLIIWVGEDEKRLAAIKQNIIHPGDLYFLKRQELPVKEGKLGTLIREVLSIG